MKRSFLGLFFLLAGSAAWAGSIFLTGHDPDFHATVGSNTTGARNINQAAISYIQDPLFNPFVALAPKFLFVESNIALPGGHTVGADGIVASGYGAGVNFDKVDASGLNAALNQLGTGYSAIVVASDYGGILTSAELDILNARSADIIQFLNNGGGLYAMSQSNSAAGARLITGSTPYGFLPFIVTSVNQDQSESGYTVTPFGAGLGLADSDVNGNFSHVVFTSTGGMSIVDIDDGGRPLSLATRSTVGPGGVVPEPATMGLAAGAGLLLLLRARQRRVPVKPRS